MVRLHAYAEIVRLGGIDGIARRRFRPSWPCLCTAYEERLHATVYSRELSVVVDRLRARFSAWYEMFPRSTAAESGPPRHLHGRGARVCPTSLRWASTSSTCRPSIPSGSSFRKGRNNTTSRPSRATQAARGLSGLPPAA